MKNVDRWMYYSRQKKCDTHWAPLTPKQFRRCWKKAHRRNDWSIGLYRSK